MMALLVEAAAALNLLAVLIMVSWHEGWPGFIVARAAPAAIALLLGIQVYGRLMGWPV